MKEGLDYELIPGEEDFWHIRILKGPFVETVYHYNKVYIDEQLDALKYTASIISTPDTELTLDDVEFQKQIGEILISVFETEEK